MYDFMPEIANKIIVVENALTFNVKPNKQINKSDCVTFLFLSNLIFSKGYTHLAEAAVKLLESNVFNFEVVFAGDFMQSPDDPDDVEQQKDKFLNIVRKNNKGKISYIGTVDGERKKDILNRADILVLPTNYHVEGQPVSIIEAMAYSCAIIATNYRSIPDLVDDKNSKYVEYANVNDLAQKMELLIRDNEELASMCKWSREKFNSKFTWECHYQKMRKVILS
ncbi:glycosyltransferase family 4 protein [Paraglaciecola aquimarina]|uniref:Glycosyltransferase family 4 protein n=1 Tax=Paraglaciecola aquimarina TaxID=1235557 RepID=A0ABU3T1F4_9ALTE|nr:glycosyltransferase family 4 protein [Paraglaciecola aquimarina]MDU0356107.1 glycosyltransferase family 4 protein [Paraglaciecola aquimarina]